ESLRTSVLDWHWRPACGGWPCTGVSDWPFPQGGRSLQAGGLGVGHDYRRTSRGYLAAVPCRNSGVDRNCGNHRFPDCSRFAVFAVRCCGTGVGVTDVDTSPGVLFSEQGASWGWLVPGPASGVAMALIQLSAGYGIQLLIPLTFFVLVTGF